METTTPEFGRIRVLQLDVAGQPQRWLSLKKAATLHYANRVAWSVAPEEVTMHGGKNRFSGEQSTIVVNTIIAVKGRIIPDSPTRDYFALTNRSLFVRDRNICAYCGNRFRKEVLTRDHVIPTSRGGQDIWTNVVTCCAPCNQVKSNRQLDGKKLKLLYVPYKPCKSEMLILNGRNILACQMEFLMNNIKKQKISNLH